MIKYLLKIYLFTIFLFFSLSSNVLAHKYCSGPNGTNDFAPLSITPINISMDSSNEILAKITTTPITWDCNFSNVNSAEDRTLKFLIVIPANIQNLIDNSGIDFAMNSNVYNYDEINLTKVNNNYSINLARWDKKQITMASMFTYTLKRNAKELRSFETGDFTIGNHYTGNNGKISDNMLLPVLGANIKAERINLCPNPSVSMNNKTVDFNILNAKDFIAGNTVKDNFNLNVNVPQDCETGLDISVTFNSSNGTLVNKKYLLLDNGLQATITDNDLNQEIEFGVPYRKGIITTQKPGNFNYNVELSRESGKNLTAGEFSKTVNVLFTYQ